MPNLEYVIRPYQSPAPFRTLVIPSTPTVARERAVLTWGATSQGTMPVPHQYNFNIQCCQEKLDELQRENQNIRIMGNDGESYVDVARPQTMHLKKNERKNCDSPLEQGSFVAQSINSVLSGFDAEFSGRTVKPGDECNTTWNLSN